MHLSVCLTEIEALQIEPRSASRDPKNPKNKCSAMHCKEYQAYCCKPVRDTRHFQVTTCHHRCLKCQCTFRVYPIGISHGQPSDTVRSSSVLLRVLDPSYQCVGDLLENLGCYVSKTILHDNVQATGRHAIQLRRQWLKHQAGNVQIFGADYTRVECGAEDRSVAIAKDARPGS